MFTPRDARGQLRGRHVCATWMSTAARRTRSMWNANRATDTDDSNERPSTEWIDRLHGRFSGTHCFRPRVPGQLPSVRRHPTAEASMTLRPIVTRIVSVAVVLSAARLGYGTPIT